MSSNGQNRNSYKAFTLRPYQQDAVNAWLANNGVGLFAMATGTGKTITATSAATLLAERLSTSFKSVLVLIVCPYLHLVDQWSATVKKTGLKITEACESRDSWMPFMESDFRELQTTQGKISCVITTFATLSSENFQSELAKLSGVEIIAIYDEAHNMGSKALKGYLSKKAKYRIGLSATPNRWQDPDGTEVLLSYFGKVVYEISISDAISREILVPYFYFPVVCPLDESETLAYAEISEKLGQLLKGRSFAELTDNESTKAGILLRTRSQILGTAKSKLGLFLAEYSSHESKSSLVYCSPGKPPLREDEGRHIETVKAALVNMNEVVTTYEATTPRTERIEILKQFGAGQIDAILSMRCLDEGVDIPSALTSHFIASGTNPREFVQRRGRVLRKAPGKTSATLFDYFAMPMNFTPEAMSVEESILLRELDRAYELSDAALNKDDARAKLDEIGRHVKA
jgi:superfamily II DNA or RNA helicase